MTEYFLDRPSGPLEATEEQVRIIDAVRQSTSNILINALAGAAKSTTLEFICKYKTGIPILSLAFNKKIADELGSRLPSHVQCKTLNALGHRVWQQQVGNTKLTLDTSKTKTYVVEFLDTLPKREKTDAWDIFGSLIKAVDVARMAGYVPPKFQSISRPIITELDQAYYDETFDGDTPDFLFRMIDFCLERSIQSAYKGLIDFNDQIYMPTIFGGTFPAFPLVMVDEAQDLSPLNHAMLRKLVRQRLIAVGDPWQSIYGFRGAVSNGMAVLKSTFSMSEYNLSVSFRCPRSVVRRAQFRVPHMRWPEWAVEGTVERLEAWTAAKIPSNAAIICRNNAPLFSCALSLIRAGRSIRLLGADIGPSLVKTLKKLGPMDTPQSDVLTLIDRWAADKLKKARSVGTIEDKAECLRVFAYRGEDLKEAVNWAEALFQQKGEIQLMSGHKSKGLEFDTVYHLDPWRIPNKYAQEGEALEQELNVRYVIETRAKQSLFLISMEGYNE
jgi:DNA helicase II / ATP-dependent DNA helicase PcrA